VAFSPVPPNPRFPEIEVAILEYWRAQDIPAQAQRKSKSAQRPFVFYEGPPTANGRPGIHHVSARAVKDVFCRFKTMQGHRVERRAGWDTHGLPVEIEVEKEIGSKSKQDIETFGIAEFNARCKASVFRYIEEWVKLTERIGFWLDFERAYITYDRDYIESEWWILKNFWDRDLLRQDYKTTMHCPRCNTSLADHEVSLGIAEDVDDPSIWVKFDLCRQELIKRGFIAEGERRPVALLIWTTTPWTIGANVAAGVAPDTDYAIVAAPPYWGAPKDAPEELYIVADSLISSTFEEGRADRMKIIPASALEGLTYTPPLFGQMQTEGTRHLHQVVTDTAVEVATGTGVLHVAPAYGDLEIGQRHDLSVVFSADRNGKMLSDVRAPASDGVGPFTGTFFKSADKDIIRDLRVRGKLFRNERIKHAYPFCWRDGTPLMFLAKTSWYLRTTAVKDALIKNNQSINWVPEHVRNGRFGQWLEGNIDWAISRERFWGCPLPIWVAEDGDAICIGSLAELEEKCGRSLGDIDLHRPFIDDVSFTSNGKTFRRVTETVDVWFDSGAMPLCQWHYPFENVAAFEQQFPADFISEAMDQTRGWFYSLHAISTLLTYSGDEKTPPGPLADRWANTSAFRNVVVQGFINDAEDRKMSKSRGNTVDPWSVVDREGSDPLRWYILGNAPPGKNLAFSRSEITKQSIRLFLILWNVYSFFVTYANLSQPDLTEERALPERPEFDRWMEAKRNVLIQKVTKALEAYDAATAIELITHFVDRDLSQWYLRGNRRRFWGRLEDAEANCAFRALYDGLTTISLLMAPLAPFLAEEMYLNLTRGTAEGAASVHLADWPIAEKSAIDDRLLNAMELVVDTVHLGRSARVKSTIKVRQPLRRMHLRVRNAAEREIIEAHADLIKDELNIRHISYIDAAEVRRFADFSVKPNFGTLSKRLGSRLSGLRKVMGQPATQELIVSSLLRGEELTLTLDGVDERFAPEDFLLDFTDRGGVAVAMGGGLLVALETDLDDDLIAEGQVREVLRRVQDARRRAGFLVSDRILLSFDGELATTFVATNGKRLAGELLAETIGVGKMADAEFVEPIDLGGVQLTAFVRRV